jgi:hypothetical protein
MENVMQTRSPADDRRDEEVFRLADRALFVSGVTLFVLAIFLARWLAS